MKSNLLLTAFATMLFAASCSDSADGPGATPAAPTKMSVCVQTNSLITKAEADANARPGEININNLSVLVFNEAGDELMGAKTVEVGTTDGAAMITDVPAKTQRAHIVIVANTPAGAFDGVQTLSDFRVALAGLAGQRQDNLTMSAPIILSRNALEKDDNYIGFSGLSNVNGIDSPVMLTRIAARVDVVKLGTRFGGTRLDGRQVRVDGIYLSKAKSASLYASDADWGAVEVDGHLVYGTGAAGAGQQVIAGCQSADYLQATDGWVLADGAPVKDAASLYTFENLDGKTPTVVVLKATLLATDVMKEETRYFTAVVNPDGAALELNHDYIRRNYVYKLDITFTDTSFGGDEVGEADMLVSITADPWNTIVITPDLD